MRGRRKKALYETTFMHYNEELRRTMKDSPKPSRPSGQTTEQLKLDLSKRYDSDDMSDEHDDVRKIDEEAFESIGWTPDRLKAVQGKSLMQGSYFEHRVVQCFVKFRRLFRLRDSWTAGNTSFSKHGRRIPELLREAGIAMCAVLEDLESDGEHVMPALQLRNANKKIDTASTVLKKRLTQQHKNRVKAIKNSDVSHVQCAVYAYTYGYTWEDAIDRINRSIEDGQLGHHDNTSSMGAAELLTAVQIIRKTGRVSVGTLFAQVQPSHKYKQEDRAELVDLLMSFCPIAVLQAESRPGSGIIVDVRHSDFNVDGSVNQWLRN